MIAGLLMGAAGCGSATAATIWMREVPIDRLTSGWIVTAVQASPSDFTRDGSNMSWDDLLVYPDLPGSLYVCRSDNSLDSCLNGIRPQALPLCTTVELAAETARGLVGVGVRMKKPHKPDAWNFRCRSGLGGAYAVWQLSPCPAEPCMDFVRKPGDVL